MADSSPATGLGSAGFLAGRYRLGPPLGSGGMAEVVRAEDTRLGRPVAIKILRAGLASDLAFRRRFESEARAAAGLSHPNIVAVYDVGEAPDGRPFIVMELVEGGSLADRLRRGRLPRLEVVKLVLGLLSGLGAAHDAGLLHRDIKPGNVLLAGDGSAKVADFGIAKALLDSDGNLDLTRTSLVLGTPRYLAPERTLGGDATIRSDIWAVGVVLYEALTGQPPFVGSTAFDLMAAAGSGRVAPAPGPLTPLDERILAVATRALAPDPSWRFSSAAAMSAELMAAAGTARATGPAPTVGTVPFAPRPASAGPSGSGGTGPTLAVGAERTESLERPPAAGPTVMAPPAGTHGRRLAALIAVGLVAALGIGLGLALGARPGRAQQIGTGGLRKVPPVRTTASRSITASSTDTTVLTASSALGDLVRDVTAGQQAGAISPGSGQNISTQAQQAVTDEDSGHSAQAANDLQQAATAIANGVQSGSIDPAEGQTLQKDLSSLAEVLGLGAAATPPTTAAPPAAAPGRGNAGGPRPGGGPGPGG